jgi:hypothetical protein
MTWDVLTGVIDWWADEGLRDVGRHRFHESKGKRVNADGLPRGSIDATRHAFVARRKPWRLAQVSLDVTDTGRGGQAWRPADETPGVVVSWADDATAVLRGNPAAQHLVPSNESWGDSGLRRMLEPDPLEALVAKPWGPLLTIDGQLLERDTLLPLEFVSLSTEYYEAAYNEELDVLTSWTAFIDGEPAQRQTLTHLTVIPLALDHARGD